MKFQKDISKENWSQFEPQNLSMLSPHDAYNNFETLFRMKFDRAFKTYTDLTSASSRKGKKRNLPWLTDGLIKSCKKKSRLLKAYKRSGTVGSKIRYVKYKNILKQLLRKEEKKYYEYMFEKKLLTHDKPGS